MCFDEILHDIINCCKRRFYSGVDGIKEKVLECATQIYIEQMKLEKEKDNNDTV